jgi:radical SAM protein with 4Fe4S-binding SPASM domain
MRELILKTIARERGGFNAALRDGGLFQLMEAKIKILDGCNARCVFCNHWRRGYEVPSLFTRERTLALADELAELGVRYVTWAGGEPTLCSFLPEAIGRLRDLGIESKVTSNGTLITESYALQLREAGTARIAISLESAIPEIHDRIVGLPGAWERAVAGIGYLTNGENPPPVKVVVYAVVNRINCGSGLVGMVPLMHRLGVKRINLSPLYTYHLPAEDREALEPTPEQAERFEREWEPQMQELGRYLKVRITKDAEEGPPKMASARGHRSILGYFQHPDRICYIPFYHCTIDFNGDVFICNKVRNETGLLGNIQSEPLRAVLHSERAERLRRRLAVCDMPEMCAGCAMVVEDNVTIEGLLAQRTPAVEPLPAPLA